MTSVFCVRATLPGEPAGQYADHFKNGNYVAIGWFDDDLSDITEERIRTLCAEYGYGPNELGSIRAFFLRMKADDIVVTPCLNREFLYIGRVVPDNPDNPDDPTPSYFNPTTDDGCPYLQRRSVNWRDDPIPRSRLPHGLALKAVFRVNLSPTELCQIELLISDDSRGERLSSELDELNELANELLLDVGFLEEIKILLNEKRQIIFQGPPGTGKTYVARALAECLAGSKDRVTLVQFHPSYAYEDFVQGFRPKTVSDEQAGFELRDGPLLQAAERAREDPDTKHFLVIDEINRGNLAKVFGELYFLLEYRDSKMNLQYLDTPFSLPDNLYIIGTMNTADSSIARVDLALRRRFFFVEFHPDEEPVKGLLRRWLDMKAPVMTWVADVVDRANEKLNDRHVAIGPSYFMRKDKEGNPSLNVADVKRIWKHNVFPYIEEHLYGERNRLSDFDLKKLREEAARSTEQEDGGDGDSGVNDA